MKSTISLLDYEFVFRTTEDKTHVKIEYAQTSRPVSGLTTLKCESIKNAILPYTAPFNAEYALMDLNMDLYDTLHDAKLVETLKSWLTNCYAQIMIMEVCNNAEENN